MRKNMDADNREAVLVDDKFHDTVHKATRSMSLARFVFYDQLLVLCPLYTKNLHCGKPGPDSHGYGGACVPVELQSEFIKLFYFVYNVSPFLSFIKIIMLKFMHDTEPVSHPSGIYFLVVKPLV